MPFLESLSMPFGLQKESQLEAIGGRFGDFFESACFSEIMHPYEGKATFSGIRELAFRHPGDGFLDTRN